MYRLRISILGVMGIVLAAGLMLALVRTEMSSAASALEAWAILASYLTAGSLVIATCLARYREGKESEWWFGISLGGWSFHLFFGDMIWHWAYPVLSHLPNSLAHRLPSWIVEQARLFFSLAPDAETISYLNRIIQALLVSLAAVAGGLVCLGLASRGRSQAGEGV